MRPTVFAQSSFQLDEWGYPIVDEAPIPYQFVEHAQRAAEACPTLALLLESRRAEGQGDGIRD